MKTYSRYSQTESAAAVTQQNLGRGSRGAVMTQSSMTESTAQRSCLSLALFKDCHSPDKSHHSHLFIPLTAVYESERELNWENMKETHNKTVN